MRPDLERPIPKIRPMVGDVEALEAAPRGTGEDRDDAIIKLLRQKLRERTGGNQAATLGGNPFRRGPAGEEDKYEPQRLNRKITWQYDSAARKVPMLRRPYI
jgi:hypothetical protein